MHSRILINRQVSLWGRLLLLLSIALDCHLLRYLLRIELVEKVVILKQKLIVGILLAFKMLKFVLHFFNQLKASVKV
jgi:hypothetical protein